MHLYIHLDSSSIAKIFTNDNRHQVSCTLTLCCQMHGWLKTLVFALVSCHTLVPSPVNTMCHVHNFGKKLDKCLLEESPKQTCTKDAANKFRTWLFPRHNVTLIYGPSHKISCFIHRGRIFQLHLN